MNQWYIIVNYEGTVLAVYGAALQREAEAKASELKRLGIVTLLTVKTEQRPRVGDRVDLGGRLQRSAEGK